MLTDDQLDQLAQVLDERLTAGLAPLQADLRTLKDGQERLGARQAGLEQGQLRLEQRHEALEKRLISLEQRQETLELKMEVVNQRVITAEHTIKEALLESQQDTINVLSDLLHEAYTLHDARIHRVEDELHLPPLPPSAANA